MLDLAFGRRDFLASAAASGIVSGLASAQAVAQAPGAAAAPAIARRGLECIILGTKGGPRVTAGRSNPGYVFLVDGTPYLVDCGPRVTTQLVRAGIPLQTIRKIFITHHHSDHNIEYGNVVDLAWAGGLNRTDRKLWPAAAETDDGTVLRAERHGRSDPDRRRRSTRSAQDADGHRV